LCHLTQGSQGYSNCRRRVVGLFTDVFAKNFDGVKRLEIEERKNCRDLLEPVEAKEKPSHSNERRPIWRNEWNEVAGIGRNLMWVRLADRLLHR